MCPDLLLSEIPKTFIRLYLANPIQLVSIQNDRWKIIQKGMHKPSLNLYTMVNIMKECLSMSETNLLKICKLFIASLYKNFTEFTSLHFQ